jgi:hypothetical protein
MYLVHFTPFLFKKRTLPVNRPSLILTNADSYKTIHNKFFEKWQMNKFLHFETGQSDGFQVLLAFDVFLHFWWTFLESFSVWISYKIYIYNDNVISKLLFQNKFLCGTVPYLVDYLAQVIVVKTIPVNMIA